jgi:predicted transposase/invertase (TIGR01784 family)
MDFFCNAKGSDTQSLKQRLGSPIFDEAIGILEMISQNPEQRRKYEARLKFERDQMMYIQAAEARGEARGEAKGKAETIQLLQSLLGMPLQDVNTLMSMPLEELNQINADLVAKLRTREG